MISHKRIMKSCWRAGMTTLAVQMETPTASNVSVSEDPLSVDLSDGRTISVPIEWFPRLVHATPKERMRWSLIGNGQGIHWEDIDEDVSVGGLLAGQPSGESQTSLRRWLSRRAGITSG
ncbi:DUF2442 domain-containing protein [Thiocapsa sp.]|uniref:DUF2442 domain-containing protein n=1 Tax=Thiocapsa sp. TaxID=2024551 RepID=UPI002B693FE9|nr:DUF2442 domain-containing protein [Thiocapsa sp.]HSO84827.1 DUF2442 domain-containing protein [Thiocapsa sp.]